MKIGEKSKKNFALVRLLMVMMTNPAMPKPIRRRLSMKVRLRGSDVENAHDDGTSIAALLGLLIGHSAL
jgi:hypothetical protein